MTAKITIRKGTHLGRRTETKTIALPGGAREVRTRWIDSAIGQEIEWPAGSIVSTTLKGDARKGTLVVLVESHLVEEF